jgi:N-methylhydantoinase A
VDALFRELEDEVRERVAGEVERQVDVRYFGQSRYMTVDAPAGRWDDAATRAVVDAFTAAHEREYGYTMPPHIGEVEVANLRVVARAPVEKARLAAASEDGRAPGRRRVHFRETGFAEVPVHHRSSLVPGSAVEGPAIVEQPDSTTILPPGATARADAHGNLVVAA